MALIDMDEVVNLIHEAGIPAYVEQTGGGCATIYAGTRYVSREPFTRWTPNGVPAEIVIDETVRWSAGAGPGWFEGPGWTNGRGVTEDFCVGIDDDGEATCYFTNDSDDERTIANRLVNIAHVATVILAMAGYVPTTGEEN